MLKQDFSDFLPTGLGPLDRLLGGGWFRGGLTELCGEEGGGKTTLAIRAAAGLTRKQGFVSLVSKGDLFFPPSLAGEGALLHRVLLLRPETDERARWSAVEVARSGLFPLVVVNRVRWDDRTARRLQLAAEASGATVILLTTAPAAAVTWPLLFRAQIKRTGRTRLSIRVLKSRRMLPRLDMEVSLDESENPGRPFSRLTAAGAPP